VNALHVSRCLAMYLNLNTKQSTRSQTKAQLAYDLNRAHLALSTLQGNGLDGHQGACGWDKEKNLVQKWGPSWEG
jgi:hypothetical protein